MPRSLPLILLAGVLCATGCASEEDDITSASEDITAGCSDRFERHASFSDNDTIEQATQLGDISDDELELFTIDPGVSLRDVDDVDWYQIKALDASSRELDPLVIFNTGPDDSAFFNKRNVELCGFVSRSTDEFECLAGTPAQEGELNGCCAVVGDVGGQDMYGFQLDLDTTWGDDSATIYVRVRSKQELPNNSCYRLIYSAFGTST